jgi:hypothetical protein
MKTTVYKLPAASLALALLVLAASAQSRNPFDQLLGLLNNLRSEVAAVKSDTEEIRARLAPPPPAPFKLSSGLFSLPANAVSVDWAVVNNDDEPQTVTVTVYKAGNPRSVLAPGPLTHTIAPGAFVHNANSVGAGEIFVPGFYYEVVVETGSPNVLPAAQVWDNFANRAIPGTLIPAGSWAKTQ